MAQAAVVPAVVAARGERLATKAQQGRRTESITRLQPAGRAAMKKKVERQAFGRGRKGDEAWAASTRDAAAGFVIATRQALTTFEHVSYMLEWNELLEEKGFGTHVREASLGEKNTLSDGRRTIGAVKSRGGKMKVRVRLLVACVRTGAFRAGRALRMMRWTAT